ncbi:hypothetical protein Goshw_009234 [Gossypium schwendimanii]|uniref:Uncharacterized protein n=1 Tax=Gossypium schwendimanii TaxID=34291 RepID=A0A7J9NBJ8_GOSSC|nr:hypothetical protein [Gossypium schwendimanii]
MGESRGICWFMRYNLRKVTVWLKDMY